MPFETYGATYGAARALPPVSLAPQQGLHASPLAICCQTLSHTTSSSVFPRLRVQFQTLRFLFYWLVGSQQMGRSATGEIVRVAFINSPIGGKEDGVTATRKVGRQLLSGRCAEERCTRGFCRPRREITCVQAAKPALGARYPRHSSVEPSKLTTHHTKPSRKAAKSISEPTDEHTPNPIHQRAGQMMNQLNHLTENSQPRSSPVHRNHPRDRSHICTV